MRDEGRSRWYRYDPVRQRATLALHVQPNAKRSAIAGIHGDALKVKIAAPAVDNKANDELIDFLSEALGVSKSAVVIRRGGTGRRKLVEVIGGPELVAKIGGLK